MSTSPPFVVDIIGICAFLNQSGYEASGYLNDFDAMYSAAFDLIVSDIMMPGIDGYEFAKTVRELDENIPILFMTARDDFATKQRDYRVGIEDCIVKPIDLDELFLRIGALLRRAKIASIRKLEVGHLVLNAEERTAWLVALWHYFAFFLLIAFVVTLFHMRPADAPESVPSGRPA